MKLSKIISKLQEEYKIPIEIGDTVLMGKFKNKPVVVKSISMNEKGDLLINGKSAARFRIKPKTEEELPKDTTKDIPGSATGKEDLEGEVEKNFPDMTEILEGVNRSQIMEIVELVYPEIVKDLGGSKVKVEVHNNIYRRLGAVGEEDLMQDNNPYAQYDWDKKKIYLYASAISNVEHVIRSLLHEHTHTRQNRKKFKELYKKYNYNTHPFEKAATRAEGKWRKYLKYLDIS